MSLCHPDSHPVKQTLGPRYLLAFAIQIVTLLVGCEVNIPEPPPDLLRKVFTAPVGAGASFVTSGDLNQDGTPDLVVCNSSENSLSLLFSNGDGTFQPPQTKPVALEPSFALVTDLNRDDIPDLLFNSKGTDAIFTQLGRGQGKLSPPRKIKTGKVPLTIIPGDFNQDNNLDLAVTLTFNKMQVFIGKGDGTFKPGDTYQTGSRSLAGVAGDFDRDGFSDLALAVNSNAASSIRIYSGDGKGTFKQTRRIGLNLRPLALVKKDMNGDHLDDLVCTTAINDNLFAFFAKADGSFEEPVAFSGGGGPVSLAVENFDSDALPDVVVANSRSSSFSLITRAKDGGFYFPTRDYITGGTPLSVTSDDFNGDGLKDIAVVSATDGTVAVYIQRRVWKKR